MVQFNVIFHLQLGFPSGFFHSEFFSPASPTHLHLTILTTHREQHQLRSSSLYRFLPLPVTSSLCSPHSVLGITLMTAISLTPFSQCVKPKFPTPKKHPKKLVLHIIMFTYVNSKREEEEFELNDSKQKKASSPQKCKAFDSVLG